MAPISSKPDHAGEELRLELEALNQALQYRNHIRRKSHSPLLRHTPSPKHPLQPKPSFKVPFRSTSVISFNRPKGPASPSSTKPLHYQNQEKKGPQHYQHREKKGTHVHEKKGHHQHQHHERKSFWRWRPFRAISHLIMSSHLRLHVLFSLQVHRIEGLPVPMNGLRLTVRWICKNQGLQTMPSRIFHGIAEFGETLRHQCTVYGTRCPNDMIRYDAKPSTLSIVALDVDELELAKHHVDLSSFLVQNDVIANIWQENSHSYELSGMAKGSSLIVSFTYELAHHATVKGSDGTQPTTKHKKTSIVTKSPPLLKQGLPLIDISTFPPPSEPGADAALCDDIEQLDLVKWPSLQEFSAENSVLEASNLSDSGFSSSFEFKPNLDSILEDEHQVEFSFLQSDEVGPASFRNVSLNEEEGLLMSFPLISTLHICDTSNLRKDKGFRISTQMQSDQWKPQETWDSGQEGSTIGQWVHEESKFIKVSQTESDDEVDLIAEEFLNMLGMD